MIKIMYLVCCWKNLSFSTIIYSCFNWWWWCCSLNCVKIFLSSVGHKTHGKSEEFSGLEKSECFGEIFNKPCAFLWDNKRIAIFLK